MRIFTLLVTLLLAQTASGQASAMLMAFAAAPAEAASDWLPQVPDMAINSPVCFGEDLRVTFAGQRPTETLTYLWTGPRGFRVASAEWVQRSVDFNAGGRYKFTVTDEDGRSAFRYYDVTVTPPPIITVEPVPAITCLGQNITLRASGGENYVWSGPRLTKAGGDTVLFNHYLPGDYRITVTGKEVGGVCTASETIIVTVQPAPKVSAGQDYTACAGLETQLVGTPGASEAGGVGVWSGSYVTPAGYFKADVPGSYSVRYTYTNEYGCKASDDALICVGGPPVASFTLPVNSVCTKDGREDLIRPVNTTPEGGCKPISYEWSVEYDGGECNSGSGKVFFEEGTTKNSRNPVMNPNKTGRYYLTLVALSECGSSTFLDTFSVFSKPLPEIVMSEDLFCDPRFINLGYDSPVCHAGGDFTLWRFPTASPPVVFEGSDPPPVYYEAGKHTVYVMSDNVCGTGNDTLTFTVMDHPDADFQFPSDTVCIGDTIQPIDNSGGTHLEYLWESPDTLISFSDSSQAVPDIAFGNLAQGWYSLTVTLSNLACPPSRQVIDVYVELPPQVTLAPIPEFCETASFTPTATYGIPLGSIDSFLWELSDGTTTTVLSTDPQVGPLSITTPGRYTLKVSATNRCKTVSSSRSFRIARTPEADFGASADVVCTTGANTITLTDRSGGDVDNYNWTVTNAGGATVFTATDASPTFTFTPAQQPGFYTIRADISNTACPMVSSWDTLIQVKENPTPTIDPIADGCTELRFTPTADYGPYAADIDSVRWTFPAGSSVLTSDQPAPGEVYLDRTGRNFPVILTVYNYCDSVSDTTYFDILEPPVAGFSLDTFVCIGDNLSPVNTTTGDDLTYRWSILPDSAASFSDSTAFEPVITFAGPRGSYPVRLITGNTTCGYDTIIRTVEVGAPPRIAIANIPDGCEEAFVVPSVSYGLPASEIDSVHWRLERLDNGPAVLYSGAPTGGTFHADRTGSYRLTVTAFNFCAPDGVTAREDFRVYERPEPALDLSTNLVCKGGSVTVTNVSGGDITQTVFTLYNPAGTVVATSSGSPATFTLDPVAPLGYYTIAMETGNPGCGTFRRDTTVTVSISPLLEIDPVADQCGTSEVTLSARLLGIMDAGNVISWQLWDESGALVMETGLLDDVTTTLPPGTYHSNANVMNRCGDDRGRDTFTIYQPPVADFDLNTLDVCRSASLQLTNTSSGDFDAVNWTVTDGSGTEVFTSTDADPTFSFDPAQPTGPYTVHLEVSNPLCSPSTKDTLIQLSAPPSIVLDSQPDVCEGTALTLSAVLSNTADIDSIGWRITNASGATVFFDQTFSPASVSLPAGSYDVEATVANACGTVTSRDQFRIYERPVADFTLDETRVCTEGSITATNTSTGDVTGLTFELLDQAGTVLSSSTGSPATFSFGGITDRGDYTVRLTVSNPFCGSFTRERTVRLYTPPTIVLNPQPDDCDRTTVLLSATTSDRTYIDSIGWRITDASGTVIYQDNNFNPAPVSLTTGLYAVEATVKNVCGYASSLDTFQVFETVRPRLVIDTNFICPGGTLTAIDSSAGDVTIRNFEVIDPSGATVATQTTSPAVFSFPTGSTPGDYILRMTVGNPSCGTLVRQTGFRVSESPTIVLDAQPDDCATTTVTLSATTSDPAFLDSIGWRITDASGTVVYSQASYNPVPVSLTPGVYAVEATVVNACGTETSRDTFQLYEAPEADFTVDTDFVCIGDNLTAVNNSRGDVTDLQFLLLDSAGTTVASAISSPATFTFPAGMQPGDYTLRLETGNPACGYTAKDTTIRLNAAPSITLDPQPDACDAASITLSATTSDQAFIDSIGWRITDASGGVVYVSNSFRPASITLNPGLYAVEAGVKNGCGEAVSRDTFQVYESPVANFTVNRDFVCRSGFVVARNTSTGDADNFTFTLINGLGSVIASSSNSPVSFNLNRTLSPGDYTLRLTVRNALCGTSTRDTIIRLTAPPTIDLNPTADACDNATVSLTGSTSNPTFIDSIGWRITDLNGAVVYTDNTFSPAPVTLPTGTYAVEATVTNDCGSDTKRDTFQIFSTPEPAFTLDATTVCEGSSITATNTSTGDVTDFTFEVLNQGGTVIFASSASPATFTFDGSQPIGDYVLRLTAGNPECGTVSRDTTIRLSAEPTIVLTPQDDDCDATPITLSGSTSDVAFIDSIGWRITDSSGTVVFTDNSFNPASINLPPGLYFVDATVANACGSDTSRDTFRLYEVSEPAFVLDTDFTCQGGTVTATNTSMGDVTDFTFEVLNQGGTVLFASTASPATFTFDGSQPIGDYVLRLTAGNPECVTVSRDTTIRLSAPPTVLLDPKQIDYCESAVITLSAITSDTAFIDSIGWQITDASGTVVFTDRGFYPAPVMLTPGLYAAEATVLNGCGSDTSRDTFQIFATPQPSFALAGDLVCADRTLTASITATGDVTDFTFSVLDTAGTVLMTSQDSLARFSFAGALPDGDYYLQLEVSNPQCGPFFRDTLVRLVSPPTIILDNQADACGETDITLSAATSDTAFIDSFGWQITDTSGTVVYTDNSFNPGPVSLLPGTYAVEATVRNGCGSDTSRDTFRLYKRPVPDFTLDTDLVCGNGTLTATSSSTGDVTDFTFEVIDPAGTAVYSSSASPATFAFDGSLAYGEYLVRLTVTNPVCGSLAKDTAITFTAAPDLVLNAQPDACGPIAVQLTASITNGDQADSVGWRITDAGGTVLLSDASLTPPAVDLDPGTYFVEATIANACTTVTDRDTFRIYEAPRADFDLTADLLCGSRDFTAANTSTGDITSFTFDVLDASGTVILSSTDSVAAFTFPLGQPDGAYTLRLTAGNPSCGSVSRDTMIRLTAPPAIVLDAQPDYCDPTRVQLTATSTDTAFIDSIGWRITTPDGKEVFSHYDFNPGSVDLAAGLYLVEATVKNDCGTDTSRDTFRIFALPQPAFTLDTDVVCRAGSFTVSNSSTGDVSDLTFEVLDPAGATVFSSNASPATFRFTDSHPLGDYTLRMTVGNDACGTAVRDTLIRLDATPAIVLDAQPDYCDTAAVQLTATLTDTTFADSIRWTITEQSGGVVYTDRTYTPAPANLSPGTYAVAAEIFGACGPGISRDTFRIYERPEPAFALNGDLLCQDRTLTVTHTSTGDVTDFSFSVLDAGGNTVYTSDQSPARFAFADALVDGDYTLRLEVSNPQCGTLTRDTTVRLQAPPTVILDPQTDYCDAATVALSASTSDPAFIDSIGWRITDTTGAAVYTDGSFAPATVDLGPGTYAVEVTVANACGSDVSRDTFRILSAPVVQLALAGDSLCRTTTVLTGVVNTSTGDDLQYAWSVTPAASISDAGASAPDFTFSASGTYVVTAEVSNATCATVTWRDTVVVRTAPQVDLAAIPDFCGMATFDPAPAFGNLSELDSVRWTFPGATGGDATAAYPGTLAYAAPGSYTVTVAGYNGCGTDTASRTFRVLEPIALDVALDTTLSCALPYEVRTVNRTTGDDLTFDWSVSGGGVNAYDRTAREPVLTLTDAGTYVITLEVSNPVCGTEIWRDTVAARPAPVPTLADLTEFCGDVLLTPGIDYLGMRIDSVRWTFTGSDRVPASSTGLYPTDVPYTEAGDYTYSVDIYNACGVTRLEDRFTLDTMPDIDLGPRDTVCLADGSFVLATPVPAGGTWRDAAGRPGVVTADGTFDPAAAGDGLATLEYVYTEGACVTVASREIEVMDLSYVTLTATEIDVCVTETAFPLTVGSPAGGWYTGPGVTDSTGVLDGSLLSAGDYTLSYHYREPGSPCAVSRDFTLHLRPRPQPVLEVPEILCSGDTVQLFHRGTDAVTFAWSLGDGQASTDENPVFVFQRVGLDTITLTTTSAYGCSTTVTREIEVGDAPFARFRMSTDEICAGQPVTFTDRSRAYGATAYHWDFGGGVTSDLPDPGPVSFAAGARDTTYKVTLTLTNTCGSHTFSSLLKVLRLPEVDFVATDTVGCSPFTVGFSNLTRGQADRYEWYVDGVLHATYATPPAYTFTAPADADAVYRVSLLVYNACGVDSSVQLIRVRQTAVVAAFTADPTEGCETVDVQFNNESSTGPDLTYRWDFGDGTTSTEADPSHLFPAAADDRVYTVSLIAGNGCSADTTQAPVTVYARPEIAFTTNNDVCTGRTIAFTSQSPASLTDHRWDFGDGQTLTGVEHPEHAFSAAGTYTVTLTARSVNGCLATFREDIEVRTKPEARFTLSTTEGCAPLPVRIFNQTTGADNYEWDFGDGNVFRGADPGVHVYQQPGEYTVSLRVSNAAGCTSDTIFSPVRVFGAPEAAFAFENTDACAMPQEVIFANDSRGATEYTWDFGNGQESDLEDLAVVYNESGTYEVNLTATNAAGCSTTEAMELTLYEPPVASLGFTDTVVCGPLVLPFLNQSSWSDYFDWSFSDGYTSTAGDLRRSFTTTGDYSLTLVASNAIGCADTLTMTNAITVLPVPEADFSYYEQVFDGATRLIFSDESGDDAVAYGWDFGDGNFSDVQDPTHDYEDGAEGQTVRHWVTNEYGCVDTTALPLDLEFYGGLYIPNILTPLDNTIDEQDIFLPKGLALTDYYIAIYTRTGQLVWESTELDEKGSPAEWWDGTYQGEPMMAGTYVWRIHRAEFLGGRSWPGMPNERGKKTWSGYITLLR